MSSDTRKLGLGEILRPWPDSSCLPSLECNWNNNKRTKVSEHSVLVCRQWHCRPLFRHVKWPAPQYLLMVPYAVIELFLHVTVRLLWGVYLVLFLLVSLGNRVLLLCVVRLSDIQKVRPQLLQLTARDAHQCGVQPVESKEHDGVYHSS